MVIACPKCEKLQPFSSRVPVWNPLGAVTKTFLLAIFVYPQTCLIFQRLTSANVRASSKSFPDHAVWSQDAIFPPRILSNRHNEISPCVESMKLLSFGLIHSKESWNRAWIESTVVNEFFWWHSGSFKSSVSMLANWFTFSSEMSLITSSSSFFVHAIRISLRSSYIIRTNKLEYY